MTKKEFIKKIARDIPDGECKFLMLSKAEGEETYSISMEGMTSGEIVYWAHYLINRIFNKPEMVGESK